MVDELYKSIVTYYDTIFKTGYMSEQRIKELLVLDFITDITSNPDYMLISNKTEQGIINRLYNCITDNCLM